MKKILAVAVATAISAPAMADLTIGGSADYFAKSADSVTSSSLETNLDVTASTTLENGVFAKAYMQLEVFDAGEVPATATTGRLDVDDNYLQLGNASANVKLGNFAVNSAFIDGDDDFQVTADAYDGHGVWLASGGTNKQDVAVEITALEGVTVQYATSMDSANTDAYQLYVGATLGDVAVKAEYENVSGDDNATGFAASAATTVENVGLALSYAKNEEDDRTAKAQVKYMGVELNVQSNSTAGAASTTSYYGAYGMNLAGIEGATLTLGYGNDDGSDVIGARVVYGF